ncbi:hypothetical protein C8F04DRAFT_1246865 [Mycena alexandri]|uniref:Uncharacterized protein n=1 Tax=Mycena alexandri TaxID=1745969 RepID=A0AAD6WP69_9AGAR|nr:hypothetical protein C8F04DRAFT_1246865 [Mycena alexandri]
MSESSHGSRASGRVRFHRTFRSRGIAVVNRENWSRISVVSIVSIRAQRELVRITTLYCHFAANFVKCRADEGSISTAHDDEELKAMNSAPYMLPDPDDMTGLPIDTNQNSNTQSAKGDPEPNTIPCVKHITVPFTLATYPRIIMPFPRLTQNMNPAQVEGIKAAPTEYIAVFAVNKTLTFHTILFDLDTECWVIMTLSSNAIHDTPQAKAKALGQIKHRLWADSTFVNLVNAILATQGVPGSALQRVVQATKSFKLVYIDTGNAKGEHAPVYQLTGKPISKDPKNHCRGLALICGLRGGYIVGMHELVIDKCFADCLWCKLKMHPVHGCPFHGTDRWLGTKPGNAQRYLQRTRNEQNREGHQLRGGSDGKASNVRRGTANTGTDPQGLASLWGSPQLAMNTNNNNNILTSLGTWTQANGQNWASTSGEGTGPTVSHALNDGVCVFGDRNTLHGQREPGEIHATTCGTPGEEPRPSASGPVRNQIPVAQAGNA